MTEIKSPFTGGNVRLCTEKASVEFRGEAYSFERAYYVCEDTGIDFTTTELDEKNMEAVYELWTLNSQNGRKFGYVSPEITPNLGI